MRRLVKSETTKSRAQSDRRDTSAAEQRLWRMLRDRKLIEAKFRRQAPLGDYVVDFVCFDARLIVELDGPEHSRPEQAAFDAKRTAELEAAVSAWSACAMTI